VLDPRGIIKVDRSAAARKKSQSESRENQTAVLTRGKLESQTTMRARQSNQRLSRVTPG